MPGFISLNGISYPVAAFSKEALSEYASAIREGLPRRVDRALADSREQGGGDPRGLGYRRGRKQDVEGGIWKSEWRCEIAGQYSLPLEMESETEAAGDLSGEVAAAGRMISVNSDIGNTSGKKRLYVAVGAKLFRTVSDTDFTLVDTEIVLPTGTARILAMAEVTGPSSAQVLALCLEQPTDAADAGFGYITDPTASPPVFTQVETGTSGTVDGRIREAGWVVPIDDLELIYIHEHSAVAQDGYANVNGLVTLAYGFAANAVPTDRGLALKKGDQIAGVIGHRIWILTPLIDALTSPNATKVLKYINAENYRLVDVPTRTRNVTWACRYDHPSLGVGVGYGDGKSAYWTNGSSHVNLGWLRHQGRDVACSIKGGNPTGDRLGVLVTSDTVGTAWYEEYIPAQNKWFGIWQPFSKRFTIAAQPILPGGTVRGTTLPWGAEGMRRYFVDPAAVNSTFVRQKHYGTEDRSNPLTTSVGVDDFEDGPLTSEFPLYDNGGGPEETGALLQGYFEGDANVSADETVLWEYTVDQSTYPDFATYTAVDQTTALASGGATFRRYGLRGTLDRGATATKSPNGATFVARSLKEPNARWVHGFKLDVKAMGRTKKKTLRSELETARDAKRVLLVYEDFSGYVFVTPKFKGKASQAAVKGIGEVTEAEVSCVDVL